MATGIENVKYGRPLVGIGAGLSQTYTYACASGGYDRILVLGHNSNTGVRGIYALSKNSSVTIVEAPNITISVSNNAVTITNNGTGSVNGTII